MKGSRLLLHIGTEKTGTTAWQAWLAQQRDALDGLGFAVPASLGPTNHRRLPTSCFNRDRIDDFVTRAGLAQVSPSERQATYSAWQQAFAAEVALRPHHTWLVSSEQFSSRLTSQAEVERLRDCLEPLFEEVALLLVLREPLQTAISAWTTLVRNGGYVLEQLPSPDHPLLVDRCDHRRLVQRWQQLFPHLQVHLYARDMVQVLAQASGLPDGLNSCAPPLARNPSLPHQAIVEIARLNHHLPVYVGTELNPEREQRIAAIVRTHAGGPVFVPTADQQARFAAHFADSTAWIQHTFFPERRSLFS